MPWRAVGTRPILAVRVVNGSTIGEALDLGTSSQLTGACRIFRGLAEISPTQQYVRSKPKNGALNASNEAGMPHEEGRRFDGQMVNEALDGWNGRSRGGEEFEHLFEQPAVRTRKPVRGDRAGRVAIAQRECLLETVLDVGDHPATRMIDLEQPRPA